MDANKWIKWADFDDDGEENGCWCIGEGGNHVAVAVTVGATEQEANLLTAAPELLAALERVVACAVDPRSPAMDEAREAIAKAKG